MSLTRTAALGSRSLRLSVHTLRRPCPLPLVLGAPGVRTYASKKKKGSTHDSEHGKIKVSTDSLVPGSQQILAGEVYFKAEESMKIVVDHYRKEVADMETRSTGRVTPAMLSPVRVHLPGGDKGVRLEEIATVGVREGTTLMVTVFEEQVCNSL